MIRPLLLLALTCWLAAEVESFTLKDGRTLVGTYDEKAGVLTLDGPGKATLPIAAEEIVSRAHAEPAPVKVAKAKPAEAKPADPVDGKEVTESSPCVQAMHRAADAFGANNVAMVKKYGNGSITAANSGGDFEKGIKIREAYAAARYTCVCEYFADPHHWGLTAGKTQEECDLDLLLKLAKSNVLAGRPTFDVNDQVRPAECAWLYGRAHSIAWLKREFQNGGTARYRDSAPSPATAAAAPSSRRPDAAHR